MLDAPISSPLTPHRIKWLKLESLNNGQTETEEDGWMVRVRAIVSCDVPDHTRGSRCHSHRFCVVTGCLRHRAQCSVPMPTRLTSRRGAGRAGVHYSTWQGRAVTTGDEYVPLFNQTVLLWSEEQRAESNTIHNQQRRQEKETSEKKKKSHQSSK